MQSWKTLKREKVLDYGKWLSVENHTVELPNGQVIDDWAWVITPAYINVLAVTSEGEFLCFKQTKYSVEGTSLGVIGGYIEPDEEPLAAAKRELQEEMGQQSEDWTFLGKYAVDGNRGAGVGYLYLARQAHFVGTGPTVSDDLETLELLRLSRAVLQKALLAGEFKVLSWAATVALALQYV